MTLATLWRGNRVETEVGISRSTISRRIRAGLFPRPISLGARAVAWPAQEVVAVSTALIRGDSEEAIRKLVSEIESGRASWGSIAPQLTREQVADSGSL